MIPIPGENQRFTQPNNSDIFGVLYATKNIDLDEEGYISLASRVGLLLSGRDNGDMDMPTSFGRHGAGEFLMVTTDEPFEIQITDTALGVTEDNGSGNPGFSNDSRGTWFNSRWYATDATALRYRTAGSDTWSSAGVSLTSGKTHALKSFINKNALAITNGNTVKLVDTSHSLLFTLTIPSDFEAIGLAYSNQQLGIITRLGDDSDGQNADAFFFVWNGASNSADGGAPIGADRAMGLCAYEGSFLILTRAGELKYWNGGGFETLAQLPVYFKRVEWGDILNLNSHGDIMRVEGDVVYINIPSDFVEHGPKGEGIIPTQPAGVWVYDPKVGLYHKYAGSNSQLTMVTFLEAGVNTTTNIITANAGTIADTGNPVKMTDGSIGGIKPNKVYYSIKLSSSTFQLAETKEKALAGDAIDLTSVSGTGAFLFLDVVDYGSSVAADTGGVELMGSTSRVYDHLIFGARFPDHITGNTSRFSLCMTVPDFKNIGYFITSRIQSADIKDTWQRLCSNMRPLLEGERIIVKTKSREYRGVPTSVIQFLANTEGVWASPNAVYTVGGDFDEAQAAFDAGEELELEVLGGAGAGQMSKIVSMTSENGTCSFELEDELDGAVSGRPCTFMVDNWKTAGIVTSEDDENTDGLLDQALDASSPWVQLKVILEGAPEMRIGKSKLYNETHES